MALFVSKAAKLSNTSNEILLSNTQFFWTVMFYTLVLLDQISQEIIFQNT